MHRAIFRKIRSFFTKFLLGGSLIASVLMLHKVVMYDIVTNYNTKMGIMVRVQRVNAQGSRDDIVWVNDVQQLPLSADVLRSSGLDTNLTVPESHPLENSCKYSVLNPDEESIQRYVKHVRHTHCDHVMLDLVSLGDDGILRINYSNLPANYSQNIKCMYRSFAGALKPHITVLANISKWVPFRNQSNIIYDDQIEVQCFEENDVFMNEKNALYRFAFAQIAERPNRTFTNSSEDLLSIDIIVLDSTSLNMMRRHMNSTYQYFLNNMGALHLEGYNKVADNSMVNLLPVLAGKRYGNQAQDWPSEYPLTSVLDLESIPFIWKDFQAKGCATMFNDDPMHFTRGLFHYPWEMTKGFIKKPTEYYYRPWHVYQRKKPAFNSSMFCFGNEPYYRPQLNLVEQMINRYKDKCHFSFSFFTDLPHDNPSNLEQMDDTLSQFLHRLHLSNALNHTVLIIMGDHGHRIAAIMYTFIGRIEERTPFFSIYFPEWFRKKHPEIIQTLRKNKNRFTSNYDVHQMLKDIINGKFDTTPDKRDKGISLFQEIPKVRSCREANVPDHHCSCLVIDPKGISDENLKAAVRHVVLNYTNEHFTPYPECQKVTDVELITFDILTTTQMIQHGMRNIEQVYLDKIKSKYLIGEIEYIETKYRLIPTEVEAIIRLQHDKKRKKLFVNVHPLVTKQNLGEKCSGEGPEKLLLQKYLPKFCTCSE